MSRTPTLVCSYLVFLVFASILVSFFSIFWFVTLFRTIFLRICYWFSLWFWSGIRFEINCLSWFVEILQWKIHEEQIHARISTNIEEGDWNLVICLNWNTSWFFGTSCTALVVGSDDVASCYSIGVLTRRQVGRGEGSRGARVVASCQVGVFRSPAY